MPVDRVRVTFQAGPGGNAYTNFYFGAVTSANLTALANLLTAVKAYIPSYCTYVIPSSGDTLSELNGKIIAGWGAASPGSVTGSGTSAAASLAGWLIDWRTATVVDGHRPIAKTIIVPGALQTFDTQGKVTTAAQGVITTAAANFLTASAGFCIWHRPVYDRKQHPPVLTRPGSVVPVNSGSCNPNPTVLRSRRQ